jgi:3-methyladenine DNA glycosylase/8-oxoguanine DNA glycosylase
VTGGVHRARRPSGTLVRIALPSDFSFDAVVRSHGWYDLPPFVYDPERGVLETTVSSGSGPAAVRFRAAAGRLEGRSDLLDRDRLSAIARRVFSLDLDLSACAGRLSGQASLLRALRRGGGRMLRAPGLFEDAVKMLLTTNCSWEATRGMVTRLIALAGEGGRAFPGPEAVSRLTPERLAREVRCGYRAGPLLRFARRVASGRLDLSGWEQSHRAAADVRAEVLAERGFGPYAAEGLLRILGRHDFLAIDSWVRMKYRKLHPGPARSTDRSIARRYARYGEWKGLALWLDLTRDWHEREEQLWPAPRSEG